MASPVYIWFCSEVFFWRSLASMCWSVLCLPVIMFAFLLFSNISVIHPLDWIFGSVASFFSLQVFISLAVHAVCLVTVTWFSLQQFSVVPDVETSQLAFAASLFKLSRLPLLVVSLLAGSVSSWSLSRLCGKPFQSLSHLDETDTYARIVLNEEHLFLVLSGIGTGLVYYISFFHKRKYYLHFPDAQTYRMRRVRSELSSLCHTSFWKALNMLKYFYILYFLFGSFPKSWIESSFKISEDPEAVPINSIRGLLHLSLLLQTFLCVASLTFTWSLTNWIVRVFHTDPLELPVVSDLDFEKDKTLPQALACNYGPLLQHLAMLDLHLLAFYCHKRRLQLLSLSQPGGHPRTWVAVSGQTLILIKEFCEKIMAENWSIMSKISVSVHMNGKDPSTSTGRIDNQNIFYRGIKDAQSSDPYATGSTEIQPRKILVLLKGLPFISQILAEGPEYNSRVLFSSSQLQIWAVEALSEIAAKAYTEDKYGVVQTVLPTIIATLLDLHEVLEKHLKLTASVVRRGTNVEESPPDILLKQKLFLSNKASIYRIVKTYRNHLSDLHLHVEHLKKLHPFTESLA